MELSTEVSVLDWVFRVLAGAGTIISGLCAYILNTNAARVEALESRLDIADKVVQQNRLDIKGQESAMANLQLKITENVSKSIERVHDKIEEGNKRTDAKIDFINRKIDEMDQNLGNKVDQLGRDLRAEHHKR